MESAPQVVTVTVAPGIDLVADAYPGDGSLPVVLLHGLSQQRRFWGPVIRRMRTRPIAALDQRGHGDSDTSLDEDFSPDSCGADVVALLDTLGWDRAVVVGHSWGASVALASAAASPDRVAAVGLVDGGLWSLSTLGPRAEVRARLTPPPLGGPTEELWDYLASTWSAESRTALEPTFVVDESGAIRTRIGFDRHMKVLDGLLDHDPVQDLARCADEGIAVWAALCEAGAARRDPPEFANLRIQRWGGAVHDVPLQWPALVAGFVDALVESEEPR